MRTAVINHGKRHLNRLIRVHQIGIYLKLYHFRIKKYMAKNPFIHIDLTAIQKWKLRNAEDMYHFEF